MQKRACLSNAVFSANPRRMLPGIFSELRVQSSEYRLYSLINVYAEHINNINLNSVLSLRFSRCEYYRKKECYAYIRYPLPFGRCEI